MREPLTGLSMEMSSYGNSRVMSIEFVTCRRRDPQLSASWGPPGASTPCSGPSAGRRGRRWWCLTWGDTWHITQPTCEQVTCCQQDRPGQLGVQKVGQHRQQDGREDEDENEGRACQKLKYGKLFISICICVLAPRKPQSKYKFCIWVVRVAFKSRWTFD